MKRYLYLFHIVLAYAVMAISTDSYARTVKGKVVSGEEALSKVIVTDGHHFTQTRKDGSFKMKIADTTKFVYVISPSGYAGDWSDGSPKFYQQAEGKDYFTFDLVKTGDPSVQYNMIAVADPQPIKVEQTEEFAGAPLDDICQTLSTLEGPSVGLVLGDVCFDRYHLMQNWKDNIIRAGIPFYVVPGNHDHVAKIKNDVTSIDRYHDHFGPANYAFFIGKDLVIMLDNIIQGMVKGKHSYTEGYTEGVLAWVKGLLKYVPSDTYLYIAQHSPLNGRFKDGRLIHNGTALLEILKGHQVHFISGHNHVNYNFEYAPGVIEHNVAAVCGTWWDAYHCPDGTPRGFKVYTKKDGALKWYYKSVGKEKDFQYEIFLPGECPRNPESVVVNLWDYDKQWYIGWTEDGKPMGSMKQVTEYNPLHTKEIEETFARKNKPVANWKRTQEGRHYYVAIPSENASEITITIQSRFGQVWIEKINLKQNK